MTAGGKSVPAAVDVASLPLGEPRVELAALEFMPWPAHERFIYNTYGAARWLF